jgi:hypothetical protein
VSTAEPRLTAEQHAALVRHGYDPTALPAGISGAPRVWTGANDVRLRPRVCYLDGIQIEGHERSDLDTGCLCIHCRLFEDDEEDEAP